MGRTGVVATVVVVRGDAPVPFGVPVIEDLALVPLTEGILAELGDRAALITPDELMTEAAYGEGYSPPSIPDFTIGVDMSAIVDRLARQLGVDAATLATDGRLRRVRVDTLAHDPYPRAVAVSEASLREAAVAGADFLLRHQSDNGRFTYVYDPVRNGEAASPYALARHAGTTYFLAQVHRLVGHEAARAGAIRALGWIERHHIRRCGGEERWCVVEGSEASVGSSALTAVAAAEVLETGRDARVDRLLRGLTAFLRNQQRADGELMHVYDLVAQRPVDIQHLFYSGEAALALFAAHRVLRDERDLVAARRLMDHLTGKGWNFFGSQYYYGEEHWTCIAAGAAASSRAIDTAAALDFCRRWAAFSRAVQYQRGETPWDAEGAYGVGPVAVPLLTPAGSRTEAMISIYEMSVAAGVADPVLRDQIERALAFLLRWQLAPGPRHLVADPVAAHGGIPGSPADLQVRNDFVQHGGSAMVRWAHILERERHGGAGVAGP
jgi:hypothetical protein